MKSVIKSSLLSMLVNSTSLNNQAKLSLFLR